LTSRRKLKEPADRDARQSGTRITGQNGRGFAWAVLAATFHLVGINVHLPHVRLAWPWQSVSAGTTTDTDVGPWVLQKTAVRLAGFAIRWSAAS
jgi:hypothetical protein